MRAEYDDQDQQGGLRMATMNLLDTSLDLQEELDAVTLADSDKATVQDLRKSYAEWVAKAPLSDEKRAQEIALLPLTQPITQEYDINPEDLPVYKKVLELTADMAIDVTCIDNAIINTTNDYTKLISSTIKRLNAAKERLLVNKTKLDDIRFITNAYKGFNNVRNLTNDDFTGGFLYSNHTFSCATSVNSRILLSVKNVSGNGYVGNRHVLTDENKMLNDTDDRGDTKYLVDNSPTTAFEYSRLITNSAEASKNDDVNLDTVNAICTIDLAPKVADNFISMLKIESDTEDIMIKDVLISSDGNKYTSALKREIDLSEDMYNAFDYVAGSDIVAFHYAPYVRLILSSSYTPDEKLGYTVGDTIKQYSDVKRKVIRINDIKGYNNVYEDSSFITDNLVEDTDAGIKKIAVFCNEYVPDDYVAVSDEESEDTQPIAFTFIINGVEYPVKPINSNEGGTKIISCAQYNYLKENTVFLNQPINTAQLKVDLRADKNGISPFIGNLKVCFG